MLEENSKAAEAADQVALSGVPFPYGMTGGERWYVARFSAWAFGLYAKILAHCAARAKNPERFGAAVPRLPFVIVDLSRDRWRSINGAAGVASLVMNTDLPMHVPHGVVEAIIERGNLIQPEGFFHTLRIGQKVKILSGPFAQTICQLERLDQRSPCGFFLKSWAGRSPFNLITVTFV